jgi:hypothetical protein
MVLIARSWTTFVGKCRVTYSRICFNYFLKLFGVISNNWECTPYEVTSVILLPLPSGFSTVVVHRTKPLPLRLRLFFKAERCSISTCQCMYACMCICIVLSIIGILGLSWPHQGLFFRLFPDFRSVFMATIVALGPPKSPPYFTPTDSPVLGRCSPPTMWTKQTGLSGVLVRLCLDRCHSHLTISSSNLKSLFSFFPESWYKFLNL